MRDNQMMDTDKDDLPSATDHSEHESGDAVKVEGGASKTASNSKDPSRPRRKKARRACFACQRAHLTCGDERPCQRCIKRGLQDACHDGVRKKAKYLHDAPDGALVPGAQGNFYNQANGLPKISPTEYTQNGTNNAQQQQQKSGTIYASSTPSYNNNNGTFDTNNATNTVLPDSAALNPGPFTATPASPTFSISTSSAMPSLTQPTNDMTSGAGQGSFGAFFDPSDPALFNFDLASMNFGNRYGALEFGMLGHMATGAGDTPPSDNGNQRGGSVGQRSNSQQFGNPPGAFTTESPSQQSFMFGDPVLNDWSGGQNTNPRMNVGSGLYGQGGGGGGGMHLLQQDAPHAYAIGSNTFASPSSTTSPHATTIAPSQFDDSPMKTKTVISTPHLRQQSLYNSNSNKRRHREPSAIYDSVKEPYSYTGGFHKLIAFIKRRFSPPKTVRIAKALASIRPSFIATTKTLNQDDLIFMEKCFQRTLWEYEDFINACGTPTIVCRRTGEVAAVGKEFSILTGWKKEVLLGKEPNLNVNTGGGNNTSSQSDSTSSSIRGGAGGRMRNQEPGPNNMAPVFLAELLDDDSVIEFYEDFARLAFGDSRGSVMNTCKLLKYKTKEDMDSVNADDSRWNSAMTHHIVGKGGIVGEAGMNRLGFKDGRVECSYCWTVKRDVFDIPMLIVMNFLPHI
ncbi:Transcriptional regulator of nonfermentable carbon utilization [Talaromyces marneffei ATCC 18224]